MRDRHCSDERLLAYLDGESGYLDRWRTRTHLKSCWECRARLAEAERDTGELARLGRLEKARWEEKSQAAKLAFLARVDREARERPAYTKWGHWWRLPASVAGGALVMVAGYAVWHGTENVGAPTPRKASVGGRTEFLSPPPVTDAEPRVEAAPRKEQPVPHVMPVAIAPGLLAEAELEAVSVVRAYPSLGLAVFTFERDGAAGLRITGVAEGEEQRKFLLSDFEAAVRSAPWTARIQVPEDVDQAPLPESPQPSATVSTRPAGLPILLELLRDRMEPREANEKANEISTSVIRHSSAAWTSAWTLKRLAQRFPDATVMQMSDRGRATLAHIVEAESRALRTALAAARSSLPLAPAESISVAAADCWSAVERVDNLAHSLMASGGSIPQDPRKSISELASLLGGIESTLESGELTAHFWPSLAEYAAASAARP